MPGGVGGERGEDDRTHALGHDKTEEQVEGGDENQEDQQLPELDADIAIQEEVRFAARTLIEAVNAKRAGKLTAAPEMAAPREK